MKSQKIVTTLLLLTLVSASFAFFVPSAHGDAGDTELFYCGWEAGYMRNNQGAFGYDPAFNNGSNRLGNAWDYASDSGDAAFSLGSWYSGNTPSLLPYLGNASIGTINGGSSAYAYSEVGFLEGSYYNLTAYFNVFNVTTDDHPLNLMYIEEQYFLDDAECIAFGVDSSTGTLKWNSLKTEVGGTYDDWRTLDNVAIGEWTKVSIVFYDATAVNHGWVKIYIDDQLATTYTDVGTTLLNQFGVGNNWAYNNIPGYPGVATMSIDEVHLERYAAYATDFVSIPDDIGGFFSIDGGTGALLTTPTSMNIVRGTHTFTIAFDTLVYTFNGTQQYRPFDNWTVTQGQTTTVYYGRQITVNIDQPTTISINYDPPQSTPSGTGYTPSNGDPTNTFPTTQPTAPPGPPSIVTTITDTGQHFIDDTKNLGGEILKGNIGAIVQYPLPFLMIVLIWVALGVGVYAVTKKKTKRRRHK